MNCFNLDYCLLNVNLNRKFFLKQNRASSTKMTESADLKTDSEKMVISSPLERSFQKLNELTFLKDTITNNFKNVEDKINDHFESLKTTIELRKTSLIIELKKMLNEIQGNSSQDNTKNIDKLDEIKKLKNFLNNEKLEFLVEKYFGKDDPTMQDLSSIIKSHGKLIRSNSSDFIDETRIFNNNQIDCKLEGSGLKQCYVNERSKFILKFLNRDNSHIPKSNVMFLDIFIITSGETTTAAKSNFQTSRLTSNDKTGLKMRLSTSASSQSNTLKSDLTRRCKCDCTLECIGEGVYAINYKLDKRGIYLLNILVNKEHVGDSPYKLKCLENSVKTPLNELSSSNRIKRVSKTQSSYNISSTNGKEVGIPNSVTNLDLKQIKPKVSESVPRTTSMSNIYNNNKLKKASLISSSSKINQSGFNFSSSTSSSRSSMINKTDDDLLINGMLPLTDLIVDVNNNQIEPGQIDPDTSKICKEDDFLFQIGSRGRNNAEFLNPQAVCATNDFIYISDSNNQKVDVFAHNGEFKFSLAGNLHSTSKIIRRPIGIDSTFEKKILVVDYEFKCVNAFEENGKFLGKMCQGKLLGPKGICVNKHDNNQIVVADSKANCVCIFDSEGRFLNKFGNLGNKNENFAGPQYVACLSNGDICITDFYNHCIKVFDSQGNFRYSFGTNGLNEGQFNGPTGITADVKDNIIVVDWGNSRIQVSFDSSSCFSSLWNLSFIYLIGI